MKPNNNKQHPCLPWIVWGLSALFYFYEYLLQVSPTVMVADLMRSFSITAATLGNLTAFYFYAYASTQMPIGVFLDRFGPRKLLTIAAITCGIGCFLFGTSTGLTQAIISRTLIGLGSAFASISCMNLAARWFHPKMFAFLTGLMLTIGMLGAIFGEAPLAIMVDHYGWQHTIIFFGFVGIAIAMLIWLIVRDRPTTQNDSVKNIAKPSLFAGIKIIIKSKQTWIAALYGAFSFAPTTTFGALWGVPFLMRAYHISKPAAAGMMSFIFVGWAIGAPLFGWFSDFIGRRKSPMLFGTFIAFLCLSFVIYIPNLPHTFLILFLFGFGFFSSSLALSFSVTREINPTEYSGTTLGFTNMLNMVSGAIAQPLIGIILDYLWQGGMSNGIRIYSLHNYQISLAALPIFLFIAFLLVFPIQETFCLPLEEQLKREP